MQTRARTKGWGPLLALLTAAMMGPAAPVAHAHPTMCVPEPEHIPGATPATAMPAWPAPGGASGGWVRGEVSDARWTSGALVDMHVANASPLPVRAPYDDQARFRMVRSAGGDELAVSIQMKAHERNANIQNFAGANAIWFAVAREDEGDTTLPAVALKISTRLVASDGTNLPEGNHIAPGTGRQFFVRVGGVWEERELVEPALPSWLSDVAIWNDPAQNGIATNGAAFALQFKIALDDAEISATETSDLRYMVWIETDFGAIAPGVDGYVQYTVPDIFDCTGTPGCVPMLGGLPIIDDPAFWIAAETNEDECSGIKIESTQIASRHSAPSTVAAGVSCTTAAECPVTNGVPGFCVAGQCYSGSCASDAQCPATGTGADAVAGICQAGTCRRRDNCRGRSNCLSSIAGDSNHFSLTPNIDGLSVPVGANDLTTKFRISQWGSVFDASQWQTVATAVNTPAEGVLERSCDNTAANELVCGLDVNVSTAIGHQCMLAEAETTGTAPEELTFVNAAAFVNTRFERASLVDVVAQINLRNMPDVNPGAPNHEVLLRVVKTNMPEASSAIIEDDIPAMEATRAQVDRDFAQQVGGCERPTDYCIPVDGPEVARCGSFCGDDFTCPAGRDYTFLNDVCLCFDNDYQTGWCEFNGAFPVDGGYNPLVSAKDGYQVLASTYPTYMVYPYLVTNVTEPGPVGRTRQRLISMPSFGVHAYHEGPFHGWLTGMVYADGTPIQQLRENVFKITVSKTTGVSDVRLLLSAEEPAHPEPFSTIAGSATTLGFGLGNVFLTGVSATTGNPAIDLTKGTASISKIIRQGTKELVTNLTGPRTLTRLPGATPFEATFVASNPSISVAVVDLLGLGHITNVAVLGASVGRPSTCGWFGSAMLETSLKVGDGVREIEISGSDQWSCVPAQLLNL